MELKKGDHFAAFEQAGSFHTGAARVLPQGCAEHSQSGECAVLRAPTTANRTRSESVSGSKLSKNLGNSRHALTVGFLAAIGFCIGSRVLPAFSRHVPPVLHPSYSRAPYCAWGAKVEVVQKVNGMGPISSLCAAAPPKVPVYRALSGHSFNDWRGISCKYQLFGPPLNSPQPRN